MRTPSQFFGHFQSSTIQNNFQILSIKKQTSVLTSEIRMDMDSNEKLCLKDLRELVQGDRELDKFAAFLDDRFLLHFVRGKKENPEEAFKCIKCYIKVRKQYPDYFKSLDTHKTADILLGEEKNIFNILKSDDRNGNYVYVAKFALWDPTKYSVTDLSVAGLMAIEDLWNDEYYEKRGIVGIYDTQNISFGHAKHLSPYALKQMIAIYVNALPIRVKGLHFVNMTYLSTLLYKLVRTLLPQKLKNRLHVYTSSEMHLLQEHFSPDALPKCLGGNLTKEESYVDLQEMVQRIIHKQDYYDEFAKLVFTVENVIK